jgi:transposase InsO family protein
VPGGRPRNTSFFDRHRDLAAAVDLMVAREGWAAPRILELLATQFDTLPTLRQLQRYIRRRNEEKAAIFAAIRDPDAYKSKFRLSLGRADGGVDSAHQVWEVDTTKADVMTTDGRVAVLGLIDRYSRLAFFIVAPSESGQSVRRLIREAILKWGVLPQAIATDNGSGYVNRSVKSALDLLGIEQIICPPGSPEKKPYVERLFGTFMRERAPLLEGFTGHSVADAQKLRGRAKKRTGRAEIQPALSGEEFAAILSAWTEGTYHQRKHGTTKQTPIARAATSLVRPRRAPDEDIVRRSLTDFVGTRTVGKRGIEWKGGRYWHAALNGWMGRDVAVRRDEADLGELLIFDEAGTYLCTAIDHERAGLSEQQFAEAARRAQAEYRNAEAQKLRDAARGFSIEDAVAMTLRGEAERAGEITPLPAPRPAGPSPAQDTEDTAPPVDLAELRRAAGASRAAAKRSPAEKVAEADALIARAESGEPVDDMKLAAARRYAACPEYRAQKVLSVRFGGGAARGGASA